MTGSTYENGFVVDFASSAESATQYPITPCFAMLYRGAPGIPSHPPVDGTHGSAQKSGEVNEFTNP